MLTQIVAHMTQADSAHDEAVQIAVLINTARNLRTGQTTLFHEHEHHHQMYLLRLAQAAIGLADPQAYEDTRDLLALGAQRTVEAALKTVQEEWETHSEASFLNDRFTQVESRTRTRFADGFEGVSRAIWARLGVKAVR